MPLAPINPEIVLRELDRRAKGHGNSRRLAEELEINPSNLRQIKAGRRPVSQKVASGLGFELRWIRVKKND